MTAPALMTDGTADRALQVMSRVLSLLEKGSQTAFFVQPNPLAEVFANRSRLKSAGCCPSRIASTMSGARNAHFKIRLT